jgi:hypothetical protein
VRDDRVGRCSDVVLRGIEDEKLEEEREKERRSLFRHSLALRGSFLISWCECDDLLQRPCARQCLRTKSRADSTLGKQATAALPTSR